MTTVGHRAEIITLAPVRQAAIEECIGGTCIEADGLVIVLERAVIITLVLVGQMSGFD